MKQSMAILIVMLLTIVALCAAFMNAGADPDPVNEDKMKGSSGITYLNETWYLDASDKFYYGNQTMMIGGSVQINKTAGLRLFNVTLHIDGDLWIFGNANIMNSTIIINSTYDAEFGIWIKGSGRLRVENTTITAWDPNNHYYFNVSGNMTMKYCHVSEVYGTNGFTYVYENAIWIMSDDVLITDSEIFNCSLLGICITDCDPVIVGNYIHDNVDEAIYAYNSAGTIRDNDMCNNSNFDGMWLMDCNGLIIENNRIYNTNWSGIYAQYCPYIYVANNTIYNTVFEGLFLDDVGTLAKNNTIYNAQTYGAYIADYWNTYTVSVTLLNNTIYNCASDGIYSEDWDIYVANNTIHDCAYSGINLSATWNSNTYYPVISHNTIYENDDCGIYYTTSQVPDIHNNTIYDNLAGIQADAEAGHMHNNSVHDNIGPGIKIVNGASPTADNNTVYANGENGFDIRSSTPDVHHNHAHNNTLAGMYVESVSGITMAENRLTYNSGAGMYLTGSTVALASNMMERNRGDGLFVGSSSTFTTNKDVFASNLQSGMNVSGSSPRIEGVRLTANAYAGLRAGSSAQPIIVNSTLANLVDMRVSGSSTITALNTTYNTTTTVVGDATSKVITKWFLNVRTFDNASDPKTNTQVIVKNKNAVTEASGNTGSDNEITWLAVPQSETTSTGTTRLDPLNVTGQIIPNFMGFTDVTMDKSKWVSIYMGKWNGPPTLVTPIPDMNLLEDNVNTAIDLDNVFVDADGDTLTFSWAGNTNITVSLIAGNVVQLTPAADWHGQESIVFKADDGTFNVTDEVRVIVTAVNDEPTMFTINGQNTGAGMLSFTGASGATENSAFKFDIMAADIDIQRGESDTLTFGVNDTRFIVANNQTNKLRATATFTPGNADVGNLSLNITVRDGSGTVWDSWANVVLQVLNTNQAPEFKEYTLDPYTSAVSGPVVEFSGTKSAKEHAYFNLTMTTEDIDSINGESLTLTTNRTEVSVVPDPMSFGKFQLSFKPEAKDIGMFVVNLTLTDNADAKAYLDLRITVLNVNDAPQITLSKPLSGSVQKNSMDIAWTTFDPDGDAVKVTLSYSKDNVTWSPIPGAKDLTGDSFIWNITLIANNTYQIKAQAYDGKITVPSFSPSFEIQNPPAVIPGDDDVADDDVTPDDDITPDDDVTPDDDTDDDIVPDDDVDDDVTPDDDTGNEGGIMAYWWLFLVITLALMLIIIAAIVFVIIRAKGQKEGPPQAPPQHQAAMPPSAQQGQAPAQTQQYQPPSQQVPTQPQYQQMPAPAPNYALPPTGVEQDGQLALPPARVQLPQDAPQAAEQPTMGHPADPLTDLGQTPADQPPQEATVQQPGLPPQGQQSDVFKNW